MRVRLAIFPHRYHHWSRRLPQEVTSSHLFIRPNCPHLELPRKEQPLNHQSIRIETSFSVLPSFRLAPSGFIPRQSPNHKYFGQLAHKPQRSLHKKLLLGEVLARRAPVCSCQQRHGPTLQFLHVGSATTLSIQGASRVCSDLFRKFQTMVWEEDDLAVYLGTSDGFVFYYKLEDPSVRLQVLASPGFSVRSLACLFTGKDEKLGTIN